MNKNVTAKKYFERFLIVLFFIILFLFSVWLMVHTFSYDAKNHHILISYKLWSDFGAHIPLIRSFSMGDTAPVEYPIYPGEPIRYHYMFDALVGLLEKTGVRIDVALNTLSVIGFFTLLVTIYAVAVRLTGRRAVGLFSILFFLFNGTFGFVAFLAKHPLSPDIFNSIIRVSEFPAFAPWGPGEVTAFWNLNIYTNQRHLAPAFALSLLFILTCMTRMKQPFKKQLPWAILWGSAYGALPYFHSPTLIILGVIMAVYFLVFPKLRKALAVTGIIGLAIAVPQLLAGPHSGPKLVQWYPGFINHNHLTIPIFITHWLQNLGFHALLVPVGFFLLPRDAKKFLLPVIPLFVIPNLFKFSVEVSANHKFFNFVMLLGNMATAYALVWIYEQAKRIKHTLFTILVTGLLSLVTFFLIFSGIIDFFVVANDTYGTVVDIPANEAATWIAQNTPKDAIFLNSRYLYHPASIAGRKIFLGWPYFAWSAGYKTDRMPMLRAMYDGRGNESACTLMRQNHISFVTVEDVTDDPNLPIIHLSDYTNKWKPVFLSRDKQYAIFTTSELCKK